jgi:hypothetical protein
VSEFQIPTLHTVDGEPRPFCDMLCYLGLIYVDARDSDAEPPLEAQL